MASGKPIASWIWPMALCACIGLGYALLQEAPPVAIQVIVGVSAVALFGYSLRHCWTNTSLPRQTKLNWLAAMCLLTIVAATAYLLWCRFIAVSYAREVAGAAEETLGRRRLERLTSRRMLEVIRVNLVLAWGFLAVSLVLVVYGSALSSVEVLVPLLIGLTTSAISLIWAVRTIDALGSEMQETAQLLWILMIVATWVLGATLTWLRIRARMRRASPT